MQSQGGAQAGGRFDEIDVIGDRLRKCYLRICNEAQRLRSLYLNPRTNHFLQNERQFVLINTLRDDLVPLVNEYQRYFSDNPSYPNAKRFIKTIEDDWLWEDPGNTIGALRMFI